MKSTAIPPGARPLLAKLNPPRTPEALVRERLFARLDEFAASPLVWIGAAPGAGKTTLVAGYAAARRLPLAFYRLDRDDKDPAQFFALMAEAFAMLAAGRLRLPAFTKEDLADTPAFAHRWFRAAFASLPGNALVVVDNLEQSALPMREAILAAALAEAPEGVRIVVTSRTMPGPELAEPLVKGLVAVLGDAELRFTPGEARRYAQRARIRPDRADQAQAMTEGWAAGFVALARSSAELAALPPGMAQETLSAYFLKTVYESLAAADRECLLEMAVLPDMDAALASEITGRANAGALLAGLVERHLFTERVDGSAVLYRYHPMLRAFLLEQLARGRSAEACASLRARAAGALDRAARPEEAIELYVEASRWKEAAAGIGAIGARLVEKCAYARLEGWLRAMPEGEVAGDPALAYLLAQTLLAREEAGCEPWFRRAKEGFDAAGLAVQSRLAADGILEWKLCLGAFEGIEEAFRDVTAPLPPGTPEPPVQIRLRLANAQVEARWVLGHAEDAETFAGRVLALLREAGPTRASADVAGSLVTFCAQQRRWPLAREAAALLEACIPVLDESPRGQAFARLQVANDLLRHTGRLSEAAQGLGRVVEDTREGGLHALEILAAAGLAGCLVALGDARAPAALEELADRLEPEDFAGAMRLHYHRACLAANAGRLDEAVKLEGEVAARLSRWPQHLRTEYASLGPVVRFAAGHRDEAIAECAALETGVGGAADFVAATRHALQALACREAGDEEGFVRELRESFSRAARTEAYLLLPAMRLELARLCEAALEHGVEREFAASLIARRRLAGPLGSGAWPWAARIATLGTFAVRRPALGGEVAVPLPRKQAELLKVLVSLRGRDVDASQVAALVWPEADASQARRNLDVTLHRLRSALGEPDVIVLAEGRLTIDWGRVWLDVHAFEVEAQALSALGPLTEGKALAERSGRLVDLYGGDYLADEPSAAWAARRRDQLRALFLETLAGAADRLEALGAHGEAEGLYRRGLEADNLSERLWRGLIRCLLARGERAEALVAFRRCRELLSIVLGVAPAAETRALVAGLA